jgi:DNA-binding phage protein
MKLEEVNTRPKEAVDFLVAALESGHSEILTAYLGAMAKFHTYSFLCCQQHSAENYVAFASGCA